MKEYYLTDIDNLKGWYKNKFKIVNRYCTLMLKGVDKITRNNIMSNIYDEFLLAQNENISVKEIIGDDIEKYCQSKCSDIPKRYKYKDILTIIKYWACVLLIFEGSILITNYNKLNLLSIKSNINTLVISSILCMFIVYIYNYINKEKLKIKLIIPTILFIVVTSILLISNFKYNIQIPVVFEIIISLLVLLVYKIIYRKNSISKKEYIHACYKQELRDSIDEYHKISRRKNSITEKDYIDKKIIECKKGIKYSKIYLILPIIFSIIPISFNILSTSISDSIIYFIILLIIEYIIFIPVYTELNRSNKILLEKYKYFKDNNVSVNKWK